MTPYNNPTESTADREIVISRVFDAPRELVWQAMTDPQHVIHWWGPRGFSTTIEQMDVRVGGVWKFVMQGPDGTNYPNENVFKEIVKPERIVLGHSGGREGDPAPDFEKIWTFDKVGENRTKVTIQLVFASAKDRDLIAGQYGAVEGGKQTLERLSEHLPTMV